MSREEARSTMELIRNIGDTGRSVCGAQHEFVMEISRSVIDAVGQDNR
jgi:hypothetical protein